MELDLCNGPCSPVPSDHWVAEVFRALPDLVRHLLPGLAPAPREGETTYVFRPVALKKVAHHPDGVLWPRDQPGGSEAAPVVLLEVQMHPDRHFHRRLGAETFRLLQQHEEINHLHVLVLLARRRDLDPALALLTLPVQQAQELGPCSQRILTLRPDLIELILPILSERFQGLSSSQIVATLGISKDFWRHTRAFQDILAEGRQEGVELGRQEGRRREAFALALRLLERRCGAISSDSRSRMEALSLEHLEALALDLLDFEHGDDFAAWLVRHGE